MAPNSPEPSKSWCYGTLSDFIIGDCAYDFNLPAAGLQHMGFVERANRKALHGSLQVFADFK